FEKNPFRVRFRIRHPFDVANLEGESLLLARRRFADRRRLTGKRFMKAQSSEKIITGRKTHTASFVQRRGPVQRGGWPSTRSLGQRLNPKTVPECIKMHHELRVHRVFGFGVVSGGNRGGFGARYRIRTCGLWLRRPTDRQDLAEACSRRQIGSRNVAE